MPTDADFRLTRCQASFFTPEMQFRAGKVLAHLLMEFGGVFDGDPVSVPTVEGVPPEIPLLHLKNAAGRLRLHAGPSRLDVVKDEDSIPEDRAADFFVWACQVAESYLEKNQAKVARVACVIKRVAPEAAPAKSLARHFCHQRWIDGPLNRPGRFELHAQKQFLLGDLFEVNSWVRVKTGNLTRELKEGVSTPTLVLVEQDINSLAEQAETRELSESQIRRFFDLAPREMRSILSLYFPTAE